MCLIVEWSCVIGSWVNITVRLDKTNVFYLPSRRKCKCEFGNRKYFDLVLFDWSLRFMISRNLKSAFDTPSVVVVVCKQDSGRNWTKPNHEIWYI